MLDILRKVGLSEGEIKVYESLLNIGSASTNRIHENTGIERRNIYDILNKLIERGLVNYIDENKRRTFKLSNPRALIGYLEEKKKQIDTIEINVKKELSSIMSKFQEHKSSVNAEAYRGAEGVKAVWEDMLNYKEIYWIGSGNYVPDKFPAFFEAWSKRRIEKKVFIYHLFRHEKIKFAPKKSLQKKKALPVEFSGNPTPTAIFGNKVANFLLGKDLFAFVIESKELSENYKAYHKYLWDHVAKE